MKNPNGYGTVYKLSGKRRNPWVACKTRTWSFDGKKAKQERVIIGYYSTKKEAMEALATYNATMPHVGRRMTFKACLDAWKEESLPLLKESTQRTYTTAINRCYPLYNKYVSEIGLAEIQAVVNTAPTTSARKSIKNIISHVFTWAIRHEVIDASRKDYVHYVEIDGNDRLYKLERTVFTSEEIKSLWDHYEENQSNSSAAILVMLYTGVRTSELLNIKLQDISFVEHSINITESKTKSGIRVIPICDRIFPVIEQMTLHSRGFLVTPPRQRKCQDTQFRREWHEVMQAISASHRPHDTRHSFITKLVETELDARIIKSIVGHRDESVTDIYTHISLAKKLEAVKSFDYC